MALIQWASEAIAELYLLGTGELAFTEVSAGSYFLVLVFFYMSIVFFAGRAIYSRSLENARREAEQEVARRILEEGADQSEGISVQEFLIGVLVATMILLVIWVMLLQ